MSKLKKITLKNGLDIYLYEDKTKHNIICEYNIKFGYYDQAKNIKDIRGAAHFLEHTLVEKCKYGNYLNIFSDNFAYSNAITTPNSTFYYFDCVEDFEKSLEILLDAVEDAQFNEEDIKDVKGAIYKEIDMIKDSPLRCLRHKVMENLFKTIKDASGLGTKENIDKMNYNTLKKIYDNFYNYDNMFLIIGGNIDINKTIKLLKNVYKRRNILKGKTSKSEVKEIDKVVKPYETINANFSGTLVNVAFKINIAKTNFNLVDINNYFSFYIDLMFGKSSTIYKDFMAKKTIKTSLSGSYIDYNNYLVLNISSKIDPKQEKYFINKIVKYVQNKDIDTTNFKNVKRNYIAGFMDYSENLYFMLDSLKENIIKYNIEDVDKIENILKLNKKDLISLFNQLDFSNYAVVKINNE